MPSNITCNIQKHYSMDIKPDNFSDNIRKFILHPLIIMFTFYQCDPLNNAPNNHYSAPTFTLCFALVHRTVKGGRDRTICI